MRAILVSLLALMLALGLVGCSAQPKAGSSAQGGRDATGSSMAKGANAVATPQQLDQLTDQTLVYECPKCGMDFDRASKCSMDGAELVATQVSYICPADGKPVERAGKCPRCAVNARIEKTALAEPTPAATGN